MKEFIVQKKGEEKSGLVLYFFVTVKEIKETCIQR